MQGGRGHRAVYYTSPLSFILIQDSYSLAQQLFLDFFKILICWFIKLMVLTPNSTEGVILCVIIGDVHQFTGHCLIPIVSLH